jgi:beta-galactosidase GanA
MQQKLNLKFSSYIFWNEHEPHPGVYDFEGQNDVFTFIEMAQKTGFVVILRPGPYTCAEHEFGGLPWWLHSDPNTIVVPRTSDAVYMAAVTRWFNVFLPKIQPFLYKNGGPIISVQVIRRNFGIASIPAECFN